MQLAKPRRFSLLLALLVTALLLLWLALRRSTDARADDPKLRDGTSPHAAGAPATPSDLRPGTRPRPLPLSAFGAAARPGSSRELLRVSWGDGTTELGRRLPRESNPEAPMSFAIGRRGEVVVLDQVNSRLQRYGPAGQHLGAVHPVSPTAQDVIIDEQGRALVLDRFGSDPSITLYDPDGRALTQLPLTGELVDDAAAVTAVVTDASGILVEVEHDRLVRVADADGRATGGATSIPGRPTRDGQLYLTAGLLDGPAGRIYVQAHRRDGTLAWETPLALAGPVLHILLLDSDAHGNIYVGAEVGHEDAEAHDVVDQATVVARLDPTGRLSGALTLPPTTAHAAETFRPLVIGDDGTVYQLLSSDEGVRVLAHNFAN